MQTAMIIFRLHCSARCCFWRGWAHVLMITHGSHKTFGRHPGVSLTVSYPVSRELNPSVAGCYQSVARFRGRSCPCQFSPFVAVRCICTGALVTDVLFHVCLPFRQNLPWEESGGSASSAEPVHCVAPSAFI
jgi:hypothetical protein